MRDWNFMERRKLHRYEMAVPCSETVLNSLLTVNSITRDICEQGLGIISPVRPVLNVPLDVCLEIPDNQEKIHVKGKVIWISSMAENQFRAGILLEKFELKPIPLVLRMIKVQLKSRYY